VPLEQATWNVLPLSAVLSPELKSAAKEPKSIAEVAVTSHDAVSNASTVIVLLAVPAATAAPPNVIVASAAAIKPTFDFVNMRN
jgi:hypothetical protein